MQIKINNQTSTTEALTLGQLATELSLPSKGVAVAISNKMIPRTEWETTPIIEGADIVIIKAACGG